MAMGRAIVRDPKVFLFDEAQQENQEVRGKLFGREFARKQKT